MIKIYYGDSDRLDLQSSLICLKANKQTSIITSYYSVDVGELYKNCFSNDIFSSNIDFVVCRVENKIECKSVEVVKEIKASNVNMFLFYYGDSKISKNSKFYKSLNPSCFIELESIHDGFGGIREQELGIVKK